MPTPSPKEKRKKISSANIDPRSKVVESPSTAPAHQRLLDDSELRKISKLHNSFSSDQSKSQSNNKNNDTNLKEIDLDLKIANQYMDLGKALKQKGDFKGAATEMNKALAIRRSAVGKDHPETASTYYQLGILYSQGKLYQNAFSELKRALTIGRVVWGRDQKTRHAHIIKLAYV